MAEALPRPATLTDPVAPQERIEVIDILRGLAVLGILIVNMRTYGGFHHFQPHWTPADRVVHLWLVEMFADDKFYTLFSFLFGLGFAIQMGRIESRGARFVPLYCRRLFVLFLIGLVHTFLIWWDEILRIYAVLGFLLLLFRQRSLRTILITAWICLLIHPVYFAVVTGIHELRLADPQTARQVTREDAKRQAERKAEREQELRVYSRGNLREIVAQRARQVKGDSTSLETYMWWWTSIFSQFLLGLYVGRRRIFENIPAHLPFIRKVMWWGLGLGLGATLASLVAWELPNPAWPYWTDVLAELLWRFGAPSLCFFYAAALAVLVQKETWKRALAPLAAVGRTALSNHLFQSLVCTTVFYSYGFGLYGSMGYAAGLALTVLIFALQIALSVLWVARFRFGPVEWLWRTLTYGKLQPMRVQHG